MHKYIIPTVLVVLGLVSGCTRGDYPERYRSPAVPAKEPRVEGPEHYATKSPAQQATSESAPPTVTAAPRGPASRVALLLPLNGPGAEVGRVMLDAAQLALKDTRGATGGKASPVVLLPKNTQGSPQVAVKMAQEAIREGAQLILGPLFGAELQAVAPVARAKGVSVVSFSSDQNAAGKQAYVIGFLPEQQVEKIAEFSTERGMSLFAIVAPETAYGQMVASQFRQVVEARGGRVTQQVMYDPAAVDISPQVQALAGVIQAEKPQHDRFARYDDAARRAAMKTDPESPLFEAIFVPEGGDRLLQIAASLKQAGVWPDKVQLLGTGQWDDRSTAGNPLIAGGWFASAPPDRYFTFERRFYEQYDYKPSRIAGLAYDATALAATLAQYYQSGGMPFSEQNLTSASGFNGPVNGVFRLLPNGRSQRGLAVLEVGPQGFQVLERAPSYFADTPQAANGQQTAAGN